MNTCMAREQSAGDGSGHRAFATPRGVALLQSIREQGESAHQWSQVTSQRPGSYGARLGETETFARPQPALARSVIRSREFAMFANSAAKTKSVFGDIEEMVESHCPNVVTFTISSMTYSFLLF